MPTKTCNNIELFYQECGKGEPLLLLHGLGSHSDDWQKQIEYFSSYYRVIALDLRGHGQSSKPDETYSIKMFAKDVLALLDTLDITQTHLVGLSMGGMIAFQIAIDVPERVNSLTIINSAPCVPYNTWSIKALVWTRILIIKTLGMKKLAKIIGKKLFPQRNQKHLLVQFVNTMKHNCKSTYLHSLRSFLGWDVSDKLATLTMPVLIVAAEHDYTPVEVKQEYCKKIKNGKLIVIENSRHATPLDQPEILNHTLFEFLQRLPLSIKPS